MSNYLEASNTSNNTLLEKLDYDDYEGKTYHVNFKINTTDTVVKNLYTSRKTQLESTNYKEDAHKDSGIPIYMPETKSFAPMTITEVDFKIESIAYLKKIHKKFEIELTEQLLDEYNSYIISQKSHKMNTYTIKKEVLEDIKREFHTSFDKMKYEVPKNLKII